MSDLEFSKIINADQFYKEIDSLVKQYQFNYIDAIVFFCEKNEMEIETAASLIKGNFRIKSELQSDGEALNFLPKSAKLPV